MKSEKNPRISREICRMILKVYRQICCNIAIALRKDMPKMLLSNLVLLLLVTVLVAAVPILILTLLLLSPRIRAVFILVVVAWAVIFSIGSNQEEGEEGDGDNHGGVEEEVELELVEQRAMEQQEQVESLMFLAIQGAATTTPLLRPHDVFEIMTAGSSRRFYMDKDVPIFQCEANYEGTLDQAQLDIILRALQHQVSKHALRFPLLMEHGKVPEVLDLKDLGTRLMIDIVHYTPKSKSLIEARRRARAERQVKQRRLEDPRYQ